MLPRYVLAIGVAAFALAANAPSAVAQLSPQRCAQVDTVLTLGSLIDTVAQRSALIDAPKCLPGTAPAMAAAMSRRRTAAPGPDLTVFFQPKTADYALFTAARDLAVDPGATETVRVLSLGVLRMYLDGGDFASVRSLGTAPVGEMCVASPGNGDRAWRPAATPLPGDVREQIRATASPLERSSQAAAIRSAANCVMNEWRRVRELPIQPLLEVTGYSFVLQHLCGDEYAVRITTAHAPALQYGYDGGNRTTFTPRSRVAGEAVAETRIAGATTGTFRLYFDGDVVASATPVNGPCP